jgi:hypothetical protein
MNALDSFISPILGFNDDIPILTISVSARPPGDESASDPSAGASAITLKASAGKRPDSSKESQEIHKRNQN